MSTLTKMALAAFAGLLLGGGALALGQNSADDGLTTTNQTTTVEKPGDVSGPCDEAEHANDPRCDGHQRPEDGRGNDENEDAGDISGPCDEAEHANDPRCTGAGGDRVDNSGPGSANSGHGHGDDDGDHEDNSGPGNAQEDNSGPGNSHDDGDVDDDHSGSGHSGSGSSGSGSSGSGHSGGSDDD